MLESSNLLVLWGIIVRDSQSSHILAFDPVRHAVYQGCVLHSKFKDTHSTTLGFIPKDRFPDDALKGVLHPKESELPKLGEMDQRLHRLLRDEFRNVKSVVRVNFDRSAQRYD